MRRAHDVVVRSLRWTQRHPGLVTSNQSLSCMLLPDDSWALIDESDDAPNDGVVSTHCSLAAAKRAAVRRLVAERAALRKHPPLACCVAQLAAGRKVAKRKPLACCVAQLAARWRPRSR